MLRGAIAAALTPLQEDGALDEDAFAPYAGFLAAGGLDGILALGTTGEGMLFSVQERKRVAELFVAVRGALEVAVNCGAQSTADTVALADHAAETGADAVAVIAPPYFPLDDESVLAHMTAAAGACAPTPFYVYEFARASGYAVSHSVLERLREQAPNLAGMKVSDTPWEQFEPYLHEGLDVFVGPEALIGRGMNHGAVGAVSALASAFPEHVARAVRERSDELASLRDAVERFPRHAALKLVAARRGASIQPYVRAPLRRLSENEERELLDALAPWLDGE
jgi:dihydrodipicolinate synthase/N-acetylneuraminate lyase